MKRDDYVQPSTTANCKCKVNELMDRYKKALHRLAELNIYPKELSKCQDIGTYVYVNNDDNDDTYAGHTFTSHELNHYNKIQNWKNTDWSHWSCIAMPTQSRALDLILEDLLIMLIKGSRNKILNIFDSWNKEN